MKAGSGGRKKVLVAMSGGVDSSVAALLLKEQGWECVGCTMRLSAGDLPAADEKACCSLDAVEDARSVAFRLGMPYYVFNFSDAFEKDVIDPFVCSYTEGKTPNPCIECNRRLKFDRLYERARLLGCDAVATGHYARICRDGDRWSLKKARDLSKDQSYVLYTLTQEQLDRPDSQDICFVPDGDYAAFIERRLQRAFPPGDFVSPDGRVLGRHRGIIHYTVGQRRGLGVPAETKLYVSAIDPDANTVTLVREEDLMIDTVVADRVNILSGEAFEKPFHGLVRLRYRQPERPAEIIQDGDRLIIRVGAPSALRRPDRPPWSMTKTARRYSPAGRSSAAERRGSPNEESIFGVSGGPAACAAARRADQGLCRDPALCPDPDH